MTDTQHYQLNQWAADDQVLRTDFNADNAKIDAALGAVKGCNCCLYVKTYSGTGENGPVVHTFPYRPMAVMILTTHGGTWLFSARGSNYLSGRAAVNTYVNTSITWGDRTLSVGTSESSAFYCANSSSNTYCLLALLDTHDD